MHPNKSGYIFVYDRADAGKIENVYNVAKASNFVKNIDPKTGELHGRRDMTEGKQTNLCPAIAGGDQLERRHLQSADRPLLQDRQRVVHGS